MKPAIQASRPSSVHGNIISVHDVANHPLAYGFLCASTGRSLLVQADCLDWLAKANENVVSAIVTDPPYGVKEYEAAEIERLQNGNRGGIWRLPPKFDGSERAPLPRFTALSPKERTSLIDFFTSWSKAALRVIRPGGHMFVASNSFLSADVFGAIVAAGWEFRGEVIRLVSTLRGGDKPKLHEDEFPTVCSLPRGHYEPWGLFRKALPPKMRAGECLREFGTGGLRFCKDGSQFRDVISSERTPKEERALSDHPSLKPVAFIRQLVYAALPLGSGVILDPFAGSGSTVAAAEIEGLQAVGVERNEGYYRGSLTSVPALVRLRQDLQLHLV